MSPHAPIMPSMSLRWLYIDFNSYFASVEQQLDATLRGKPIIVVAVETDSTCAIAASYEAKAFGIKTGTPVWEAKKICPHIITVLAKHERYVEYHQAILQEVDKHIPITAVCSIDEVACRLMDNEIAPERATEIALSVKKGLAANIGEYIKCSIGIAPNRYLAKIATDMNKPDGLTLLHPYDLPNKLFALTLRDLPGVGQNIEKRLLAAGIRSVKDLWQLDSKQLRKIWGSLWGEKIWYYLRGFELTEEETKRSTVGHSHVMAPELREPSAAIFVARRLTLKAASRLRRMEYYASVFYISVRLENGTRLEESERCYRAQDNNSFLELLNHCWKRFLPKIGKGRIKKISISFHQLIAQAELQPELFPELPKSELEKRIKSEKISKALDMINQRYGRDSALVGMLPKQGRAFSGSKIAFTRIPDMEEFSE